MFSRKEKYCNNVVRIQASEMEDKKKKLISLITEENVSALQTMEDELELSHEEALRLLRELISEGSLIGSVSEDERRFWKTDVRLSDAPVLHREEEMPDFLSYDTRPGLLMSIIGFIILIGALLIMNTAVDSGQQDLGAIILFLGAVVLLSGLYLVSKRNTPQ